MEVKRVKFTEVYHLDGKIHERGEVSFPKSLLQDAFIQEDSKSKIFLIVFGRSNPERSLEYPPSIWVKEDPRPFLEQKEQKGDRRWQKC